MSSDARLGDGWADLISNRSLRHRIGVCGVLQLTQGLVGSCIISVLATDMFAAAGASSPIALLAFMHICCLGGSALCARKVDRWGRRWVLIGGYLLIGLCWTGAFVCVHFSRKLAIASTPSLPSLIVTSAPTSISNNASNQVLMNVAAVSITQGVEFYGLYLSVSAARILLQNTFIFFILLFCIVFSATIGPVVNVVSMEVFPFRVRGKAASLLFGLGILSSLIGAFVLRPWARATIVPISEHAILTDGHMITCMLVYLITAICLSVFVLVALPDTTGLALEDMEELFDAGQTGTCSGCIGFRSRLRTPHSKTNVIPSLGSDPNLKSAGNRPSAENLPLVYYEPSTLHKYSGEMRESKFLTYWEPDDDDLLLAATSSSNGNWALSFLPDAPPNTSRH